MDITKLTLTEAKKDLESKKYSAKELTDEVFNQIEKHDDKVKSFISLTKDQAYNAAEKFDKGETNSPIAGVPGSVKDLFNWKGTKTTASSNIIRDYVSPYNATVIDRLESQDALIVGKTNLDAFAHGSSTETSDFFTTKNPWDLNKLPGGSSGGSAAAVAAGMGIYSIGTETAGSIRQPSAWCGLTGLKPTYGRVPRYGVISMGSSLDCPGPIAKSVEDCAILLEILAGQDPKDATTSPKPVDSYYKNINRDIKGLKIGLPKHYFDKSQIQEEVVIRVMEAAKELEKLGAVLVEMDLMDPKYAIAVYTIICRSEVSSNLARYDGIRYGFRSDKQAEKILDQISYNRGEGFGMQAKQRSMTGAYALSAGYYDAYYKKAQQVRTLIKEDLDKAFESVDIIIGPTTPSTALEVGTTMDNPLFGEIADALIEASTMAGLPGLNVPVGFDKSNMPIGMNIFAPQFEEQRIINLGAAFQQATDWHTKFPELK